MDRGAGVREHFQRRGLREKVGFQIRAYNPGSRHCVKHTRKNRIANAHTNGGDESNSCAASRRGDEISTPRIIETLTPRNFDTRVFLKIEIFPKIMDLGDPKTHPEKNSSSSIIRQVRQRYRNNRMANAPTKCGDECNRAAASRRAAATRM